MSSTRLAVLAALLIASSASAQSGRVALDRHLALKPVGTEETNPLEMPARLRIENVALPDGLTELHRRSGVGLAFSPSLLPQTRKVTCICEKATVGQALDKILAGTALRYLEVGGHVVIERKPEPAQPRMDLANLAIRPAEPALGSSVPSSKHLESLAPITSVLQQLATVTGRVIDSRTREPLAGVQVHIPAARVGILTDAAGRYVLNNVPAGEVVIRA